MVSERDPKQEMLQAFKLIDTEQTGKISFKNLKKLVKNLGENLSDDEIAEIIQLGDKDGDG